MVGPMTTPADPPALPDWHPMARGALGEAMGLEYFELTPTRCVGRMPVKGNTQPMGLWHGGASCVLAESLASAAAFAEVGPSGAVTGIDINATHHRAATGGWVIGTAEAIRIGGRIATYDVVLTNEGHRICSARVTIFLKRPRSQGQ
jgi:1,4-dihydroxy-2-naphthoyl-CoA hydrolase